MEIAMPHAKKSLSISILLLFLIAAPTLATGAHAQDQSPTAQAAAQHVQDEGEPKGQKPASKILNFNTKPSSSRLQRLRMHWDCLKSGGKWKRVSDTASKQEHGTFSETRSWVCEKKAE